MGEIGGLQCLLHPPRILGAFDSRVPAPKREPAQRNGVAHGEGKPRLVCLCDDRDGHSDVVPRHGMRRRALVFDGAAFDG